MNQTVPYQELKFLADFYQRTGIMPRAETFIELLEKYHIALRGRLASIRDISISIPTTLADAVALQINYGGANQEHDTLVVRRDVSTQVKAKVVR